MPSTVNSTPIAMSTMKHGYTTCWITVKTATWAMTTERWRISKLKDLTRTRKSLIMMLIIFTVMSTVERITVTRHPTNGMIMMMTTVTATITVTVVDNMLLLMNTITLPSTDDLENDDIMMTMMTCRRTYNDHAVDGS